MLVILTLYAIHCCLCSSKIDLSPFTEIPCLLCTVCHSWKHLCMPVYSLGAWAIDESSPLDPVLLHGGNFLPGVPHNLFFTSDSISRYHVFLGHPLFLLPCGFHVRACLVMQGCPIYGKIRSVRIFIACFSLRTKYDLWPNVRICSYSDLLLPHCTFEIALLYGKKKIWTNLQILPY